MNTFKRIQDIVKEAKVDKGRSDYGKATIRNWRHSGPSTVEPAMFDPENKRGKTIEKRREEHKARRGVKGAKVPTYKKEEVENLDELSKGTLGRYVRDASSDASMTAMDYGSKPLAKGADKKQKKVLKRLSGIRKATSRLDGTKDIITGKKSTSEEVQTEDYYSGTGEKVQARTKKWMDKKGQKGAPGLDAMKARTAEHKAKRGVKKEEVQITERAAKSGGDVALATGKLVGKTIGTVTGGLIGGLAGGFPGAAVGAVSGNVVGGKLAPGHPEKKTIVKVKKEEFVNEVAFLAAAGKVALAAGKGAVKQKAKQVVAQKAANVVAGAIPQPNRDQQEGVIDLIKKGAKRHSKAVEKKKIKNRKAVPYAALGAGYEPKGNVIGEEGYDRMRDDRLVKYGIGHDGSDRKGSTSRPTGKQPKGKTVLQKETEKKYGKGVSALDVVKANIKAKYGKGAIYDAKKK